ncbi:MAG: integrase arm-type DNA-binding domain-containing protein [Campylobacter sp.]|uniref:tyrosine-type recombinase/integrase n=1 Tax=Campylobacter sp. TaxID=205 RepID=UPI002AA9146C|nr:integrase arm-type DNA-binding domain-containing protein [Campylobacter sp.]MCI7549681.1 integrase arm-type DNA-binding domain-containing protein [Campylobacter sp.]
MASFVKDAQIKAFRIPNDKKRVLLNDEASKNLFLNVTQTSKAFLFIYEKDKKQKSITLGHYPSLSLSVARRKADELREQIANGLDPQLEKQENELSFKQVASLWLKTQEKRGLATFKKSIKARVENHLLPRLAQRKIKELRRNELVELIKNLELKDKRGDGYETKSKTFGILKNILKFVSIEGLIDDYTSPLADLEFSDFFKDKHEVKHHRFITDATELKSFLTAINSYKNQFIKFGLKFGIYTALRSANVRKLRWQWLDFSKKLIIIPANEMKMKREFILPMSSQVEAILKSMDKMGELVFSHNEKPMSESALNYAIKALGFGKAQDFHGLRGLFSTTLNELSTTHKLSSEIIELCLAHEQKDAVRSAYNHALRLDEKRELMQFWADYIDSLC